MQSSTNPSEQDIQTWLRGYSKHTVIAYRSAIREWEAFGSPTTPEGLKAWFYSTHKMAPSTRRQWWGAVRSWLEYKGIDAPKVRLPSSLLFTRQSVAIPPERVVEFCAVPDARLALAFRLLFLLGPRRSELIALKKEDVIMRGDGPRLAIRAPKDRKSRILKVPKSLAPAVSELAGGLKPGEKLFPWPLQSFSRMFRRRAKALNLGSLGPHCARATYVTQALKQGLTYGEISKVTGHSSIEMLYRYDRRIEAESEVAY